MWLHGCSVGYQTSWNFQLNQAPRRKHFPSLGICYPQKCRLSRGFPTFWQLGSEQSGSCDSLGHSWVFSVYAVVMYINVFLILSGSTWLVHPNFYLLIPGWNIISQIISIGNPSFAKTMWGWVFGLPHTTWEGNYIGAPSYSPYPLCISFLQRDCLPYYQRNHDEFLQNM